MRTAGAIATILVLCLAPAAAQENLLPQGPGRAEVIAACSDCHGLYAVLYNRRTAREWQDTILQMQMEGSNVVEQNIPVMVQYLAAHFGPRDQPVPPPPGSGDGPAAK